MPNSDATITRLELIKRSLRRLGNTNPTQLQLSQAASLLNDKVKELDEHGRFLWTISNTLSTLTVSSGGRSYSVGVAANQIASYILALETVDILNGTTYTPLTVIDKTESLTSDLREGTGQPICVYLEKAPLMSAQKMHFFPTPGGTYTVKYTYRRRLYDFDTSSDNPDFPGEWNQKLVKILTAELAPEYGVSVQDIASYHEPLADKALKEGLAANAEDKDPQVLKTVFF